MVEEYLRVHLISFDDVLGAKAGVEVVGLAGGRVLLKFPYAASLELWPCASAKILEEQCKV